ncbi:hypothetical protein EB093_00505 [bacterium]|nr:hypothetical protein [bacterium]
MSFVVLKALHIIFGASWFAGVFFWVRMMIYHTEAIEMQSHDDVVSLVTTAERRIQIFVLNPAIGLTIACGIATAVMSRAYLMPWFHVKLTIVGLLSVFHGWCYWLNAQLRRGVVRVPSRRLRLINEFPFVLLVGIVFSAVSRTGMLGIRAMAVVIGVVGVGLAVARIRRLWN